MIENNIHISVIIPLFNESRVILDTLSKLNRYFAKQPYGFELIVVDDGSTDGTRDLINSLSQENPYIRLISNSHMGKGASVKSGVLSASGDYILFTDADLSTPIEELGKLMPFFKDGYDVIIGSRAKKESNILRHQPIIRQAMGKIFNMLVRLFVLRGIKDTQCGFKVFRRQAAHKIFSLQRLNGFSFDVEILYIAKALGYKIKDIPITWINRIDSRVGIAKDSLKMFFDLFTIKANILRGYYAA